MKNRFLFVIACLQLAFSHAQTTPSITLSFNAIDAQTQTPVNLQSLMIMNLTLGCDTTLYEANPSIILINSTGLEENNLPASGSFSLLPTIQNPFDGSTRVRVQVTRNDNLHLILSDLHGKVLGDYRNDFSAGIHQFEVDTDCKNLLVLSVIGHNEIKSVKLISLGSSGTTNGIRYIGLPAADQQVQGKLGVNNGFVYHLGDQLTFFAVADGYTVESMNSAPVQSTTYTFELSPLPVSDGYYVTGPATAYLETNSNAMMQTALNEIYQTSRPWLKELYIPIKAGNGGFNIVKATGPLRKFIGPSDDFTEVTPGPDEPTLGLQRGHYADTTTTFTVPVDGLYHVIIDELLGKVAIARVSWEMIGAATPLGWLNGTHLTESAFNPTIMSWTITNQPLTMGDWKFRYSNGWKVVMESNPVDPVSVNANLGGSINDLTAGGATFTNSNPGIYSCTLSYTLGSGYTATLIKTGNLPFVDYTSYQMGIIGDAYLKQDGTPAFWDENFGTSLPAAAPPIYTWTYNIDFIGNKLFKFRQGDDWSGKQISYGDVVIEGPAAGKFVNNTGNFVVTENGNYTIVLSINAATEIYTMTATKN
ncbi:MAG: hypothetical protein ACOYNC_01305 [Bacteroidales bacterium]